MTFKQMPKMDVSAVSQHFHAEFENHEDAHSYTCQILRSASTWSVGLPVTRTEHSIGIAYEHCIEEAKHFIYIENQFFISGTAGHKVKNRIAQKLVDRIIRAHRENAAFKVVVFMPLLPCFQGEEPKTYSFPMKATLYFQFQTICRG
jgi:phospholipase D1/2